MFSFSNSISKFGQQGEKTGVPYIFIPQSLSKKKNPVKKKILSRFKKVVFAFSPTPALFLFIFLLLNAQNAMTQDKPFLSDWANLKKYSTENLKIKPLSKGEKRIVFMGNSITESWTSIDSNFFNNKPYINRGISGQTSSQMLFRFRQDVVSLNPVVVVILSGINDIAENNGPISIDAIFGNIVSMVQLAKINKIKVVLSSVLPAYDFPWHPGLQPAEKIVKLNTLIKSYCIRNHIVYLNYYSKLVDDRKGLDKKFTKDGVHPTLAGYKIMEPLVEKAIKKALRQK